MHVEDAAGLVGTGRESSRRELYEAIERGVYPRCRFCIQVMTEEQTDSFRRKPFDLTKLWPHSEFLPIEVGELELNRDPKNSFAEVEQFSSRRSALVLQIGASPDKCSSPAR